jgi:hypothetical protein
LAVGLLNNLVVSRRIGNWGLIPEKWSNKNVRLLAKNYPSEWITFRGANHWQVTSLARLGRKGQVVTTNRQLTNDPSIYTLFDPEQAG